MDIVLKIVLLLNVRVACGEDCNTKGCWAGGSCVFLLIGLPAFELTFREESRVLCGTQVLQKHTNQEQVSNERIWKTFRWKQFCLCRQAPAEHR